MRSKSQVFCLALFWFLCHWISPKFPSFHPKRVCVYTLPSVAATPLYINFSCLFTCFCKFSEHIEITTDLCWLVSRSDIQFWLLAGLFAFLQLFLARHLLAILAPMHSCSLKQSRHFLVSARCYLCDTESLNAAQKRLMKSLPLHNCL